ncbi:MAG: hypothetical protein JWP09_366 [Candidatus Taylorbacteria bacterium]|nr:hypothetical protein [Candidatus Taylorbacteria bacterium]
MPPSSSFIFSFEIFDFILFINFKIGSMNKSRLEAFSDGVFSIVMTLLIFNVKVPVLTKPFTNTDLWLSLGAVWPILFIYFLTFFVLSFFWINHHVLFESFAKSIDHKLTVLNLIYLMFLVLVPFTASLWGAYDSYQPAVILYGFNIFIIVLCSMWMGSYILKTPEISHDDITDRMIKRGQFRSRLTLVSYAIGIILSFVHPVLAGLFYLLPVVFNITPGSLNFLEKKLGFKIE